MARGLKKASRSVIAAASRAAVSNLIEPLEKRVLFASISWIGSASGNFNDPTNWSTGTVPTATDDVTISVASTIVVTVSDAESVNSISITSPLTISSPTVGAASLTVNGGGATIGTATTLQIGSNDAVSSGQLNFIGFNNLGGSGDILFAGTNANPNKITVTDASGTGSSLSIFSPTIHGSCGLIIGLSADSQITTGGTITADGTGKITLQAGSSTIFDSDGSIGATTGIIDFEGSWFNEGSLDVSGTGTLQFGGSFTDEVFNSGFSRSGGTINITGVMDLQSEDTLDLSAATTGSLNLDGGTIQNGTISTDGTASIVLTPAGGTLNTINLNGNAIDGSNGTVTVDNGLNMTDTTVTVSSSITFNGSQGISGTGTFSIIDGATFAVAGDGGSNPASLTINEGINIDGENGTLEGMNAGDTIFNSGIIYANTSGGVLNVHGGTGGTFSNDGIASANSGTLNLTGMVLNFSTISATAGATLSLGDQTPATTNPFNNSDGVITADSSTVNIGGNTTPSLLGSFSRTAGTVNLTGLFNLQSGSLAFNASTGNYNLLGGTVTGTGASIDDSGGSLVLTPTGGTLAGGLSLSAGTPVDATNGSAMVTGGLTLDSTSIPLGGSLTFSGTQTLNGTGTVELDPAATPGSLLAMGDGGANPAALNISSGITVIGSSGTIGGVAQGDSVVNNGTIIANTSGGTITLNSNNGSVTNVGELNASSGAIIAVTKDLALASSSVLRFALDSSGMGQLDIAGMATLNGNLSIGVATGFVPMQGTTFDIANFNGFVGAFQDLVGLTPPGAILTPTTTVTGIALTTTFSTNFTGLRPTDVTLIASEQEGAFGDTVTFTASVSAPAGLGITPTGNVTFFANGDPIGTGIVQMDETAILTTSTLPAGRLQITAGFPGDTNYAADTSIVLGEVVQDPIETIGGIDPTYGTNGLASHPVGFTTTGGVAASGAQSIVVGTIGTSPNQSFGVTRYNSDGTLDTTFGTNGVASFNFGSTSDDATAVFVLAGGQVLVAGTATTFANNVSTGSQFALAEFNPNGTLDTSFGAGTGEVLTSFSTTAGVLSNDVVRSMVVSPTGNIYLGGSSDAAGHGTDFAIAAYSPNGSLNGTFAGGGKATLDFAGGDDAINSLALQRNGDLVAAGSATVGGSVQIALARYLPSGILDKHFGTLGTVTTNVRGVFDAASSAVIQPNGAIVIGGISATGSGSSLSCDFVLARYTSSGRIDKTFGGGPFITSFGQPSAVTQLVLQSNGEIVASGKTTSSLSTFTPGNLDVAVARYTAKGALDTTFNGTGKTIINLSGGATSPTDINATPLTELEIIPLDTSNLNSLLNQFEQSNQGTIASTPGGAILDAGSSGANTVVAQLIINGVDLVASVISPVPVSVPGGMKGTATISVGENGSSIATGTVTIELQFATDAEGDSAVTVKMQLQKINLRQSRSSKVKLAFVFPTTLPSGNYFLLVSLVDGSTLHDLNQNNNTALSASTVKISPPAVSLQASGLSATTVFIQNKTVGVMFTLTNNGNVTAKGNTTADLFLSIDQTTANGTQITVLPLAINLAAGKSKVFKLKFKLIAITPQSYNLLALVDPGNSLGSIDHSDSLAVDATAVVVS